MPNPRWRLLTTDDFLRVAKLEQECFPRPWTASTIRTELERTDSYCCGLIDVRGNTESAKPTADRRRQGVEPAIELVAYALFRLQPRLAELNRLAVAPQHRRRGLAALVLKTALQRLRRRGVAETFLEVRTGNQAARALYRECGFVRVGRRAAYFQDGSDALVLRCCLNSFSAEAH